MEVHIVHDLYIELLMPQNVKLNAHSIIISKRFNWKFFFAIFISTYFFVSCSSSTASAAAEPLLLVFRSYFSFRLFIPFIL